MEYTKETFKVELDQDRVRKEKGLLSEWSIGYLKALENYENLILFGVGIELPTSKERISALENSIKYWYDEKNNRDIKEFSKGFDNCYRWIKDYVRKQR